MKVQVCIIGGGPSGLLIAKLLQMKGIQCLILERKSRSYVLSRIRAGVLESGSVDMLRQAGVGERMDRYGLPHKGILLALKNRSFRIDFDSLVGDSVMVWGQTEVTADLYKAHETSGCQVLHEVEEVSLHDVTGTSPWVSYRYEGATHRVDCDYILGCDGFHGVSRQTIPDENKRIFEHTYPFGWLGILSETPPVDDELIYTQHERGFALCSLRNHHLSRYYIQVPVTDPVEGWSDQAFWDELRRRLPASHAERLVTGSSIEKSIAPLRSFVVEPMQYGRLFLVGDAAHIVPPTGAKGLNLAISDVYYLYEALVQAYEHKDMQGLDLYSAKALKRVWNAIRFSWWFTKTMHLFPDSCAFDKAMQESELTYLEASLSARKALAENYVGMPY